MPSSERSVQAKLVRFVVGEMGPNEFETWVYGSKDLESALGPSSYAELAGLDFGAIDVGPIRRLVRSAFDRRWPDEFERARARDVCESIMRETIDFVDGCRALANLNAHGVEGIAPEVVGLDSELDGIPGTAQYPLWDPEALKVRLASAKVYREAVFAAARDTLARLAR